MKEPLENADLKEDLNIETNGKLHVIFGGTKVVQHTPPSKTSGGLKGEYTLVFSHLPSNSKF